MVAQTPVTPTNGSDASAPQSVAHNTGELLADAMTLAELQGKLLVVDVQDDLRKLIAPLAVLITGAVVGLSCLPIALVTIALGLMAGAGLAPWLAFLISLLIGAAGAVGCDGEMWPFAQDLPRQPSQHIAWPNLNKNACASAIHRLYFVGKLNGSYEMISQQHGDGFRIVWIRSRG